jgi:hypothetical protein
MRLRICGGAVLALASMSSPAAAQGAWCAEDMNARNCGFATLAQCQAAASGNGGSCSANPFVKPAGEDARRPPARKRPQR